MAVPGPMPPTLQFTKDSINTLTQPGLVDGNGNPLTSANTTLYITVSDWATGLVILAQTLMTYSGTPGTWKVDTAASTWTTPYDDRYVLLQEYDQGGSGGTIRRTIDYVAKAIG